MGPLTPYTAEDMRFTCFSKTLLTTNTPAATAGPPASAARRAMLRPCVPWGMAQPKNTSSTSAGATPARSTASLAPPITDSLVLLLLATTTYPPTPAMIFLISSFGP